MSGDVFSRNPFLAMFHILLQKSISEELISEMLECVVQEISEALNECSMIILSRI